MRSFNKLILLLMLSVLGFIPQGAGIKTSTEIVKFYHHNAIDGVKSLEAKLGRQIDVKWNESNSTPTFVTGKLTAQGYSVSSDKSGDGIRFITENNELFGLKAPTEELKPISTITDEVGMTHVKYQQQINGIKIFHGQLIVHFNADGSIEAVNGRYFPTPGINTTPQIDKTSAIQIAKTALKNYNSNDETTELLIYQKGAQLLLVYSVKLPSFETPMMTIFVDAKNGNIVGVDDGIRYDGPTVGSGIDLSGNNKTINTYQYGGKYYMIDATMPMYVPPVDSFKGLIYSMDAQNDTTGNGYRSVIQFIDPNNDNNFNDNVRMKPGVSAHLFTRQAYLFYKERYNRNSYDNQGATLLSVVNFGIKLNNAYWNGICMTYGNGDGVQFSDIAGAYDVIVHEITHAVTSSTANLVYQFQPGAINESFSDVFGSVADSTDWLMGEDVFTPGIPGDALRSMQDPHNGQTPGHPNWLPAHMNEYLDWPIEQDYGGVHYNCGILNKAFYNVASVIGRSKAGIIWYRTLTVYLTNNSQFVDARIACLNASKDLFGQGSNEYNAVASGFSGVGIESGGGQTYNLSYDDNDPATGVYEEYANWELAVRFTPPIANVKVTNVKLDVVGEMNPYGNGQFTLKMYKADGSNGLPGTSLLNPSTIVPQQAGWLSIDLSNVNPNGDFYVSMKYDGYNQPLLGADTPPGNMRAYEYNASSWYQLTSPNDYSLFIRATVVTLTSVVEIDSRIPDKFMVSQNYPNPFNPSTSLEYSLPKRAIVVVVIYNNNGQKVADLVNNEQEPGTYRATWIGTDNSGQLLASGVYYCAITTEDIENSSIRNSKVTKMLLIK